MTTLRKDPAIEFAEPDYIATASFVPNDSLIANEWHLNKIAASAAWAVTQGTSNIIVAVLDSGVNAAHPDLAGELLPGYNFVWNNANPDDDFGHGTAVTGSIVAAGNNGAGVAGVAWGCRVLPVKVMDASGMASHSTIAQGIEYAVEHGARVINLSMGGDMNSSTLQEAINYAWSNNVIVIAAAGNTGGTTPQYPAACDHVVAVSATDQNDARAWFSTYGTFVSLAAPGVAIWTTERDLANPYAAWSGTSFASPIVAAVAGLVASVNPALSNAGIVELLKQSADDLGSAGSDPVFGFGRVNAYRALQAAYPGGLPTQPPATNDVPPSGSETNAPTLTITSAPADHSRLASSSINLAGTAADDSGVASVELQLNDADWTAVTGTTGWSAQVTLDPGANTIRIRAIDNAGNSSVILTRSVVYVMTAPVTLAITGAGSISPYRNQTLLEVGKTYVIRATPGPGQVFAGWEGIDSKRAVLSFVMQPGLALVAHFVPSPFPNVRGNYNGLASNDTEVTPENSGAFNVTVTAAGSFSGKVLLAGARYGFHGKFDLNGDAVVVVSRAMQSPLNVRLHLNLATPADEVTGTLSDGRWTSAMSGERNVFNAQLHPATQAGTRTLKLSRADQSEAADGLSKISANGATRVRGTLVDGRAFSTASALSRNGDCPFYLSLNHGTEVVIGWLNFPASQGPSANGTVLWVKSGTNSFAATLQAASVPAQ